MYGKDNISTPVIVLAECPPLEELIAITVCITRNTHILSNLQPHIIRCRELIFTEPEIIATPSFNSDDTFHVVLKRTLFNNGKLQARFSKIGLQCSDPQTVTPALFQSCIHYTLLARIAPSWNKAGQWLIQGRDFLSHQGYDNAVKMDLVVTFGQLHLSLVASTVRFPALQLSDIEVLPQSLKRFTEDRDFISGDSIGSTWCHVLPSMKKGQIVGIGRQLPADGPFKSYKEIKSHWKNSYGYRLPENEEGIIYYQIHFRPLGDRVFTYPDICLRARDIHCLPRVNPKPILVTFLQDLKTKMSTVCGYRLQFQSKASYLTMDIYSVNKQEKTDSSNLGQKCKTPGKLIYRNFPLPSQNSSQSRAPVPSARSSDKLSGDAHTKTDNVTKRNTETLERGCFFGSAQDPFRKTQGTQGKTALGPDTSEIPKVFNSEQTHLASQNTHDGQVMPSIQTANSDTCIASLREERIIPRFSVKKPSNVVTKTISSLDSQPPRIVPVFKGKVASGQTKGSDKKVQKDPSTGKRTQPIVSKSASIPRSTVASKISDMMMASTGQVASQQLNKNIKHPLTPTLLRRENCTNSSHPLPSTPSRPVPVLTPSLSQGVSQRTPSQIISTKVCRSTCTPNTNPEVSSTLLKFESGRSQRSTPISQTGDINDQDSDDDFMKSTSVCIKKRSINEQPDIVSKKPRSKTTIQNVDVEALARDGQLNKVNSVTMMSWLKNRGVQCRTKDKKQGLVTKVLSVLNVRVSEQ
ncbi:uncharacterized protein LOC133196618 [Saccostrea echinata]|uniref:uncharacterized protein LOC133196618 n=1 Tax=Saccostrea echinata TaxID=191078 RepID=UPI002A825817|nr:uncharacterized protein LOC133196618 [Saccostrea echinata]